jgi:hypothetical protein
LGWLKTLRERAPRDGRSGKFFLLIAGAPSRHTMKRESIHLRRGTALAGCGKRVL